MHVHILGIFIYLKYVVFISQEGKEKKHSG